LAHEAPGTHKRFLNWTQITYFCPNYDIKKFGHKVAMFLGNCSQICYAPTYMKVSERRQGFPSHTINCTNEPRGHTPESGSLQLFFYYFISHRKFCITLIFIIWKIEKFSPHEQTFQFPYYPQKLYYNKSVYVMGRLYTVCKSDLPFPGSFSLGLASFFFWGTWQNIKCKIMVWGLQNCVKINHRNCSITSISYLQYWVEPDVSYH